MATVEELYQSILGRAPDAEGLNYWGGLLSSGQDITAAFQNAAQTELNARPSYTSAPVTTAATTNYSAPNSANNAPNYALPEDVAKMYQTSFGRDADSAGLEYWSNKARTEGLDVNGLLPYFTNAAKGYDLSAMADKAAYSNSWNAGLNPTQSNLTYNAAADRWEAQPMHQTYSFQPFSQPAPTYKGLMDGDYDKLQASLAVKGKQAADNAYQGATQQLGNVMSGRGLYGSSIMQNQQTQGLDREYMKSLAANESTAAAQRYAMEQGDLQKAADIAMMGWQGLLSQNNLQNQIAGNLANTSLSGQNAYGLQSLQNSGAFDIAKMNSDTTKYNTDKNFEASKLREDTNLAVANIQAGTQANALAQQYKLATNAADRTAIAQALQGLGYIMSPSGQLIRDTTSDLWNWSSGLLNDNQYLNGSGWGNWDVQGNADYEFDL